MLGGEEEKDPDAAKKEEERQEALRQQEEERKAKHARMEAEREKVRQTIRDKVRHSHCLRPPPHPMPLNTTQPLILPPKSKTRKMFCGRNNHHQISCFCMWSPFDPVQDTGASSCMFA